jgi:hypothetical protein
VVFFFAHKLKVTSLSSLSAVFSSTMFFLTSGKNRDKGTSRKHREEKGQKSISLETKPASIGGTYVSMLPRTDKHRLTDSDSSIESSWKSSNSKHHHKHSPLIARSAERPLHIEIKKSLVHTEIDDVEELGLVLARSHSLPGTCLFSSNHILVNIERAKLRTPPLIRRTQLDELAREHAETMAAKDALLHSDPNFVIQKLGRPSRRLGENVAYGKSIRDIHEMMMNTSGSDKNNLLDRRFLTMGMGTAIGTNGGLYMCQIFRG